MNTEGRQGELRHRVTGHCPVCGGVVVFEMDTRTGELIAMHPEKVSAWNVGHLPLAVLSICISGVRSCKWRKPTTSICGAEQAPAAATQLQGS